jgi:hypothetical protein
MAHPPARSSETAQLPAPASERGVWLLALALAVTGAAALAAAVSGVLGHATPVPAAAPPAVPAVVAAPSRSSAQAARLLAGVALQPAGARGGEAATIVSRPSQLKQGLDARRFVDQTQTRIALRWMEGFYPIYAAAQRAFAVNWLLLASIHRQESAFSTAAGTYHGLNFAGCCGGPMQFNVTNRPVSTWQLVSDSYRYGVRPGVYDHMTAAHPSIYDDFDSIMAAAHLLSADGAEYALDGTAWVAAYDYYGHDATGVVYADQVLARAIAWSQHGFCVNCALPAAIVQAVHAAYGAPVLGALTAASPPAHSPRRARIRR